MKRKTCDHICTEMYRTRKLKQTTNHKESLQTAVTNIHTISVDDNPFLSPEHVTQLRRHKFLRPYLSVFIVSLNRFPIVLNRRRASQLQQVFVHSIHDKDQEFLGIYSGFPSIRWTWGQISNEFLNYALKHARTKRFPSLVVLIMWYVKLGDEAGKRMQ